MKRIIAVCRFIKTGLILWIIVLPGLMALPSRARAEANAVTLVSFDAYSQPGQVKLAWETATELDNSGFYWHRSTSASADPDNASTRISVYQPLLADTQDFIPTQGDATTGASYEVYDRDVQSGTTYYYWIESVSNSGDSAYDGPVSATPTSGQNGTAGPIETATLAPSATFTSSPESTSTSTPSATPTGSITPSPTPTSTRTAKPTKTTDTSNPYPPPNSTPIYTPNFHSSLPTGPGPKNTFLPLTSPPGTEVVTDTVSPSSTPTLAPLPAIALLFPLVTDTGTPTPVNAVAAAQSLSELRETFGNSGMSPGIILLIIVIIVIWFLLGVFLYSYIRHLETRP